MEPALNCQFGHQQNPVLILTHSALPIVPDDGDVGHLPCFENSFLCLLLQYNKQNIANHKGYQNIR